MLFLVTMIKMNVSFFFFEPAATNCAESSTLLYNTITSPDMQNQVNSILAIAIFSVTEKLRN